MAFDAVSQTLSVEELVVVVEVEVGNEVPDMDMLALWMGTTWLTDGVVLDSGGFLLKGATMAWGTFLIRHSWLPRKPGLVQKLPRGPRSTLLMGSVGRGFEGIKWWWDSVVELDVDFLDPQNFAL